MIQLWMLDRFFGLIVQAKTGVWYTNQTAGIGCRHPVIEGFYVPLPSGLVERVADSLENYGAWDDGYDAARVQAWLEARQLDEVFEPAADTTLPLCEAWIPVRVRRNIKLKHERSWFAADEQLSGLGGRVGVLTYENSD